MDIDVKTKKVVKSYYQYRANVVKTSGKEVSTTAFLNSEYSFVSAVLHSGVDCLNRPDILGKDFIVLHNPATEYPLNPSVFHWCEQMFYIDGGLERKSAW